MKIIYSVLVLSLVIICSSENALSSKNTDIETVKLVLSSCVSDFSPKELADIIIKNSKDNKTLEVEIINLLITKCNKEIKFGYCMFRVSEIIRYIINVKYRTIFTQILQLCDNRSEVHYYKMLADKFYTMLRSNGDITKEQRQMYFKCINELKKMLGSDFIRYKL